MHNRILGNVLLTRQILFVQLQKQTCTQHVYHEAYLKVGESSDNINLRQKTQRNDGEGTGDNF